VSEKIDADDIEVIIVWRNCPADIRDKLIAYWNEHNILTRPELIRQRLNTVVAVALHKSRIVGVWSAGIGPFFRDDLNFSIINTSTAPDYRNKRIPVMLGEAAFDYLESWSKENPVERLMGVLYVLETDRYSHRGNIPYPGGGEYLAAFNKKNRPVFVKWFTHARVALTPAQ